MEQLKQMKETLVNQVQGQMADLRYVNTHELGEVIDMIKDIEETIYYCTIVKAMEDKDEKEPLMYYGTRYLPPYDPQEEYYRDLDKPYGRMYYSDGQRTSSSSSSSGQEFGRNYGGRDMRGQTEYVYPIDMRDRREGRSPISRKTYIESKEMHQDKTVQMKELENYMAELSQDISEMIQMASPEEKAVLQKKLAALSSKIN